MLQQPRRVRVYLPPDYTTAYSYPVLFLQDGQRVFGGEGSWRLEETLDREMAAGRVAPLIVAAIDHGGAEDPADGRRLAEYTPVRDLRLGGGEADRYGRFLVRELMPWARQQFSIEWRRQAIAIGGSSLGGLVSLYLGMEYPRVFGSIAALSPSVWWADGHIFQHVKKHARQGHRHARIWLDIGDREGDAAVANVVKLRDILAGCGWSEPANLHCEVERGAEHKESSWASRAPRLLRYLFPAPKR